jgi:hypothetical protein
MGAGLVENRYNQLREGFFQKRPWEKMIICQGDDSGGADPPPPRVGHTSSSSSALASCRTGVSKPSLNQA